MAVRTSPLTQADIVAGYEREEWGGWGYLGERRHFAGQTVVGRADAALLDVANDRGWTADQLFEFVNSRDGRHFGDATLGSPDADFDRVAAAYIR